MEYSKENIMTRKEYLKSKKKSKFDFSKLKYLLILVVIVLLSIYLFKQLNVYNKVTKIANKVVEETALAKTMTMYYVADTYTKEGESSVLLYKSSDESRTKIANSEGLSNIKILEDKLYGLKKKKLYVIDLLTNEILQLTKRNVTAYDIKENNVYYICSTKKEKGLYKYNLESRKDVKLVSGDFYYIQLADEGIYTTSKATTSKSAVKYGFDGKGKKILSNKYIVSNMTCYNGNIYFINSSDSKLYVIKNNGESIIKLSNSKVSNKQFVVYKDNLLYLSKKDNSLYKLDLKTNKEEQVIKKNIQSIQNDENILYYKLSNNLGIYKYDILTNKTQQVTSVRTSEYICKN